MDAFGQHKSEKTNEELKRNDGDASPTGRSTNKILRSWTIKDVVQVPWQALSRARDTFDCCTSSSLHILCGAWLGYIGNYPMFRRLPIDPSLGNLLDQLHDEVTPTVQTYCAREQL